MSAQEHPTFLDDPKMIEMLDIARTLEISVMHEITEQGCTVTMFYQYEDRREILVEHTGKDIINTTYEALGKAIAAVEVNEE